MQQVSCQYLTVFQSSSQLSPSSASSFLPPTGPSSSHPSPSLMSPRKNSLFSVSPFQKSSPIVGQNRADYQPKILPLFRFVFSKVLCFCALCFDPLVYVSIIVHLQTYCGKSPSTQTIDQLTLARNWSITNLRTNCKESWCLLRVFQSQDISWVSTVILERHCVVWEHFVFISRNLGHAFSTVSTLQPYPLLIQ